MLARPRPVPAARRPIDVDEARPRHAGTANRDQRPARHMTARSRWIRSPCRTTIRFALMFLTAIDFMPNGDTAVCTAHGDVWLVSGIDQNLDKLRWKASRPGSSNRWD